jgi:hypothetical protein
MPKPWEHSSQGFVIPTSELAARILARCLRLISGWGRSSLAAADERHLGRHHGHELDIGVKG